MRMDQKQRPSQDLWRRTLTQIPSVFGRLDYLSRLRNPNSGTYEHHGLAQVFGAVEADRALRESHAACFQEWLGMSLEYQRTDLALFFSGLLVERHVLIETWLRLAHYQNLMPASAGAPERELFLGDIEALLRGLKSAGGDAA
ncbi:MAG: hypothetical protein KJZ84_12765 [Bryobacteraceae bacterium]|nr:hypothetical protein [Bryobacteraceae bacterium]